MDMKAFLKGDAPMPPSGPPPPPKVLTRDEIRAGALDADVGDAKYDYDLVVIGGGSGGIAAAKKAADWGASVALCDFVQPSPQNTTWGLGGTCVNVGCIPKKLMHTAALHGEAIHHMAPTFGWSDLASTKLDWNNLVGNVTGHIRSLNFGYTVELRKKNIKYLNAYARFVDPHTLDCTNKKGEVQRITGRRILLATGGRPTFPDIPGAKEYGISSDDIFKLKKDPKKTLVVGASYVALECAGFLTGIGRDATVMMRSIPLRGFDQDMAGRAADFMEAHGTRFLKRCVPTALERVSDDSILVSYQNESKEIVKEEFNTVLFAIGRKPEVVGINLEASGVKLAPSGKVAVDAFERTSVPHIYAIGDIIEGGLELTPVAIEAGKLLSERLFGGSLRTMNYRNVATTVFTPLEYGACGYSEEDAIAKFGTDNVDVYHSATDPLEWTVPLEQQARTAEVKRNWTYMKLVVVTTDKERVVGFHVLCPNAGEMTQGVAVAMQVGVTKADFDRTIGIHPTCAEDMTTLRVTKRSGSDHVKGGC